MPVNIGLDCQKILSPGSLGAGIEHYTYHLALNLAPIIASVGNLKLYFHPAVENSPWIKNCVFGTSTEIKFWPPDAMARAGLWPYGKYRRQAKFLEAEKLALFHGPANVTPLFYRRPTVVTVHDLIIYEHPEWFPGGLADYFWRHSLVPNSIKQAAKIIAVSDATKKQVVKHFRISPEKIAVSYEGATSQRDDARNDDPQIRSLQKKISSASFILYVGTIEPRKNLARLIEAFARIVPKFPRLKLVLAGKFGWKYEAILARAGNLKSKVVFTDYVSAAQRDWLYHQALVFAYPSLAEGFGLPVLDALVNNVPVLISKTSSLPEVAGVAAVYIDPLEVEDIALGLAKIAGDEKLREQLIRGGQVQAAKFSWDQSATETLKIYQEIITRHDSRPN